MSLAKYKITKVETLSKNDRWARDYLVSMVVSFNLFKSLKLPR